MSWTNLRTNYQDARWTGDRKFNMINNSDATVSFQDVTNYTQIDNAYRDAREVNATNDAINQLMNAGMGFYPTPNGYQNYLANNSFYTNNEIEYDHDDFVQRLYHDCRGIFPGTRITFPNANFKHDIWTLGREEGVVLGINSNIAYTNFSEDRSTDVIYNFPVVFIALTTNQYLSDHFEFDGPLFTHTVVDGKLETTSDNKFVKRFGLTESFKGLSEIVPNNNGNINERLKDYFGNLLQPLYDCQLNEVVGTFPSYSYYMSYALIPSEEEVYGHRISPEPPNVSMSQRINLPSMQQFPFFKYNQILIYHELGLGSFLYDPDEDEIVNKNSELYFRNYSRKIMNVVDGSYTSCSFTTLKRHGEVGEPANDLKQRFTFYFALSVADTNE